MELASSSMALLIQLYHKVEERGEREEGKADLSRAEEIMVKCEVFFVS